MSDKSSARVPCAIPGQVTHTQNLNLNNLFPGYAIFIRDLADSITPSVGPSVGRSVGPSSFFQIQISQLWDLIETWGFREDLPLDPPDDPRRWWTPPQEHTVQKQKFKFLSFGT